MSLIACTKNYGVPFLVGDILISNLEETKSIQLPTNTADINNYIEFDRGAPSGFSQKIYIIRPNLCIALAGVVDEMKEFLKALITFSNIYSDKKADRDFIDAFIGYHKPHEQFTKSAFLMLLLENINGDTGEAFQIYYPPQYWKKENSELFDSVIACGSGTDNFLNRVVQKVKFESSHEKGNPYQAIQCNLGLFARLLAEEKRSLYNLQNCWGAGFETIFFNNNTFMKFPEITYVIWHGNYSEDGKLPAVAPNLVMHSKYYDDMLFIRSVEFKSGWVELESGFLKFKSDNLEVSKFEVPRLDLPIKLSNYKRPTDLSFGSNRVVLAYTFDTSKNSSYPAYFNDTSAVEVVFNESENLIEIKVLQEVHDRMIFEGEGVFHTLS